MEESVDLTQTTSGGLHKAYIKTLSQIDRDKLGHMAGVSGSYVTSLVYRDADTVSLAMAIAIDKHSGGRMDFRDLLYRNELVDWDFVAAKLGIIEPA